MPDPTPKQLDATRTPAHDPAKRAVPVAALLEAEGEEAKTTKRPPATAEVLLAKSSEVISKSYRVRELPPPPVVTPPDADAPDQSDASDHGELPDILTAPREEASEQDSTIALDSLQIKTGKWRLLGRHVRVPPRWEQWLADPRRRNRVGTVASAAAHVVLLALLLLVFKGPAHSPVAPPLPARSLQLDTPGESAAALSPSTSAREPVVRQVASGELETIAIDPPLDAQADPFDSKSGIPDSKSQISNFKSEISDPKSAVASAPGGNPPRAAAPAADGAPGVSGGQNPPDLLQQRDAWMQGKLNRRTPGGRSEGIRYAGGTPQSEEAVERALGWLSVHQRANGSWSFNHLTPACEHYCTFPGSEPSTTAATGMALLPFLGAGYTHKEGPYQDTVRRGLEYLKSRGMRISYGLDLREGSSMYGHALATIALCEAYGMTHDPDLKETAQGALDYISYAQDLTSGGWRYNPGEPGDTTVTGWMLMALKSGQMARLNVPSPSIFAAQRFLDSVQNADGSQYGYQSRKPRPATTAVGLLCRMYTGWRRTNPGLVKGAAQLATWGVSKDNMYYDYYATQVLFHFAGPQWDDWNRKLRDELIHSQERVGHQLGSWYFESPQSAAGGRLYNTAMATMILEVYYRFMPLYGEEAFKGE